MATWAWDVPGYVQGHKFNQTKTCWDSVTGRFRDQAGYEHLGNHCEIVVGTPTFASLGTRNREGLLLNNTCHLKFLPAIPWEGTMLMVARPFYTLANPVSQFPWLFGTATTESSNGSIWLYRGSGISGIRYVSANAAVNVLVNVISGNIHVIAFSSSQETRIFHSTQDGITVTASTPTVNIVDGNQPAMCSNSALASVPIGGVTGTHTRLGDMVGDASVTANNSENMHVFEQHFWKGNVLVGAALPQMAAFIASLKSYYGIP